MSLQNLNTKSISKKLEKVELTNTLPVIIPEEIYNKIRFLCKMVPKEEWSGILFFIVKGSIREPSKVELHLMDILLMDIGDGAATKFNWENDVVIDYRMNNPESLDWTVGHIHSHHCMQVWFSNVDWDELNDNCTAHNFYLSLIVNNYMDMKAKVAFTAESTIKEFTCKDENGEDYQLSVTGLNIPPYMMVYDCQVAKPEKDLTVPSSFAERLKVVEKEKKVKTPITPTIYKNNNVINEWGSHSSPFPDWDKDKHGETTEEGTWKDLTELDTELALSEIPTLEDQFIMYLLRAGVEIENDTIEFALIDTESFKGQFDVVEDITQGYGAYYEEFFQESGSEYKEDNRFHEVLSYVISTFEEEESEYPLLTKLIFNLKSILTKFNNHINTKKR